MTSPFGEYQEVPLSSGFFVGKIKAVRWQLNPATFHPMCELACYCSGVRWEGGGQTEKKQKKLKNATREAVPGA